jgi:hypothetical protein
MTEKYEDPMEGATVRAMRHLAMAHNNSICTVVTYFWEKAKRR